MVYHMQHQSYSSNLAVRRWILWTPSLTAAYPGLRTPWRQLVIVVFCLLRGRKEGQEPQAPYSGLRHGPFLVRGGA